jgi:hypothetical protein
MLALDQPLVNAVLWSFIEQISAYRASYMCTAYA